MRQALLDLDRIRDLVEMMVKNDLVEVSLRDGQEEISLRRPQPVHGPAVPGNSNPGALIPSLAPTFVASGPVEAVAPAEPEAPAVALVEISSPMVGTFYAAPSPDSPPFVEAGDRIQVGTVVCILEAMKVFNEIKSEVAGVVERVLAKSAQAVEFGQPLFLVRPDSLPR
jgi:acetyl-CoA carboxylase biotin carboxyl carrier protein